MKAILAADLRYRMARIAHHGLAAAFDDLFPMVQLRRGVLTVHTPCDADPISCQGGLLLIPTAHSDRLVVVASGTGDAALLIYPARCAAVAGSPTRVGRWSPRSVVSPQGACLLRDLALPRAVRELAARHDMDVASTTQCLSSLVSEGLVVTTGGTPETFHRTSLANLLIAPWCQRCA